MRSGEYGHLPQEFLRSFFDGMYLGVRPGALVSDRIGKGRARSGLRSIVPASRGGTRRAMEHWLGDQGGEHRARPAAARGDPRGISAAAGRLPRFADAPASYRGTRTVRGYGLLPRWRRRPKEPEQCLNAPIKCLMQS